MQRTRPSQPKRLFWMVSNIINIPVLLNSFSFEITFGKKILRIHQRHLVWKTSCFLTDAKEVFYSDPYKRTLRTLLLRILILVWMLPVDLHMDFNIKKSWLVLLILVLVSLSQSPVVVTLILRYVNSSTSSSGLLFTSIWLQWWCLCVGPESLVLIFSPILLTVELSCSLFCLMAWCLLATRPRSSA